MMNKNIIVMKDLTKIQGISQQQQAHNNPILFSLERKKIEQKTSTLIQKCFKSLIKQKMTACLIHVNFKKQDRYLSLQKYHKNNNGCQGGLKRNSKTYINRERKTNHQQLASLVSITYKNKQQKKRMNKTFFSNHNKLMEKQKNTIQKQRKSLICKPLQLSHQSIMSLTSHNQQGNQNQYMSTLIAKQSIKNKIKLQSTLPLVRKSNQKLQQVINSQYWRYISLEKRKNEIKRKSQINYNDLIEYNILSNTIKQQKELKIKLGNSSNQKLINYINNLPQTLKRLLYLIFNFLQIKIPFQFNYQNYITIIQQIIHIHQRIWDVICLLFWDVGKDGLINSKDIFNVFRQYHNFDQKKQTNGNQLNKINNQGSKNLEESKNTNVINLHNVQKALRLFEKELKRINNLLSQPMKNEKFIPEDRKNVDYLEQALITKQNLKFKQVADVLGFLGLSPLRRGMAKREQKAQFFPKQLSIGGVSTYRQCFIARQHNQQTRDAKLKMEELKSDLRKKRKKRNDEILNKINNHQKIYKEITYTNIVQSQMGQTIKEIVSILLGYENAV